MDVPVQILLQVAQPGKEGAIGVAGFGRRLEAIGQLAEPGNGLAGRVMFLHHAGNRRVQWHPDSVFSGHGSDGRKENLLFLSHVLDHLLLETKEHIKHFQQ